MVTAAVVISVSFGSGYSLVCGTVRKSKCSGRCQRHERVIVDLRCLGVTVRCCVCATMLGVIVGVTDNIVSVHFVFYYCLLLLLC